jgi:indolepyruvate ferredoxin oxidoreductase beta subunit
MKFDLVIAGVGGQGNILATQVIAQCAIDAGLNVANTETKGAAQRGGSVTSHLRISDETIFSPLVPHGQADVLLGFEPLEAFRYIALLSPNGKYIINTAPVPTILSNIKVDTYPSQKQLLADIQQRNLAGYFINATQEAKNLGDTLLVNVVMLGAFSKACNIVSDTVVLAKLLSLVDERYHQADKLAFECGRRLIQLEG